MVVVCSRALEAQQFLARLHPELGIEVGERFVHQEDRRFAHDRPTQRHPLPLTTGKVLRAAVQIRIQPEDLGGVGHLLLDDVLAARRSS